MKKREIHTVDEYTPCFIDDDENEYTHLGDDFHQPIEELLEELDGLLRERYGLELYLGDCGSTDIFVCIKQTS